MIFLTLGNFDHAVVPVPTDFPSNLKADVPFHQTAFDYSHANWNGFRDHLRDFLREVNFKIGASAVASKFVQSSPWFSTARAVTVLYRNHFLRL